MSDLALDGQQPDEDTLDRLLVNVAGIGPVTVREALQPQCTNIEVLTALMQSYPHLAAIHPNMPIDLLRTIAKFGFGVRILTNPVFSLLSVTDPTAYEQLTLDMATYTLKTSAEEDYNWFTSRESSAQLVLWLVFLCEDLLGLGLEKADSSDYFIHFYETVVDPEYAGTASNYTVNLMHSVLHVNQKPLPDVRGGQLHRYGYVRDGSCDHNGFSRVPYWANIPRILREIIISCYTPEMALSQDLYKACNLLNSVANRANSYVMATKHTSKILFWGILKYVTNGYMLRADLFAKRPKPRKPSDVGIRLSEYNQRRWDNSPEVSKIVGLHLYTGGLATVPSDARSKYLLESHPRMREFGSRSAYYLDLRTRVRKTFSLRCQLEDPSVWNAVAPAWQTADIPDCSFNFLTTSTQRHIPVFPTVNSEQDPQ